MTYSWYDYWEQWYVDYYADYYEYYYWPKYYGVFNVSDCDNYNPINSTVYNTSNAPIEYNNLTSRNNTLVYDYYNQHYEYCNQLYNGTFPPSPYVYNEPWFSHIDLWISITFSLGIILTVSSYIITIAFFYQIHKVLKTPYPPNKITLILSSFCIICHLIYNTCDIIGSYFWLIEYNLWINHYFNTIWESFWCVAKISLYCLFAYRYYNISAASLYQSSKTLKTFVFISIILFIVFQIILTTVFTAYHYDYTVTSVNNYNDPSLTHKRAIYLTVCWIIMLFDFMLIGIIGYLIIRTILKLVIAIESHNNKPVTVSNSIEPISPQSSQIGIEITATGGLSDGESIHTENVNKSISFKRSSKQMDLIQVTARLTLLCFLSIFSSVFIQLLWLILDETEYNNSNEESAYVLSFLCAWLWSVDGLINMLCVYFSMAFAKTHYQKVCNDICKCHTCVLWCIMNIVSGATRRERKRGSKIIKIESNSQIKSTNQMQTLTLTTVNKSDRNESVENKSVENKYTEN